MLPLNQPEAQAGPRALTGIMTWIMMILIIYHRLGQSIWHRDGIYSLLLPRLRGSG